MDQGRIDIFLAQKFRRNIETAGEQKTVHLVQCNVAFARVEDVNVGMFCEKWLKPFFIFWAHPGSQISHRRICDFLMGM